MVLIEAPKESAQPSTWPRITVPRGRSRIGLSLVAALLLVVGSVDALPITDPVERTARPYVFDLVSWEMREVLAAAPELVSRLLTSTGATLEDEERRVAGYFLLAQQIRSAENRLRELEAGDRVPAGIATARDTLAVLQERRAALEDEAEALLRRHVGEELRREGLTVSLGPIQPVFPPLEFELTRTPTVLVVSPRHRIELQHSIILRPEVTSEQAERMERTIEAAGLSTIVEPTGGFSTYPAMIPETGTLDSTLSSIVHEWLHGYLFFRPLGWNYFGSNQMRSINETVADIGGNEIGARLVERYRRHLPPSPSAPQQGLGGTPVLPRFEFNKEMRETRLEADRLLAEGRIDDAERYMEERRKVFVANGYLFRKLNQAYFAFHGTYGGSPSSVSPIFGYLRTLREQSGSLREFLQTVSRIRTYDDLLTLVHAPPE